MRNTGCWYQSSSTVSGFSWKKRSAHILSLTKRLCFSCSDCKPKFAPSKITACNCLFAPEPAMHNIVRFAHQVNNRLRYKVHLLWDVEFALQEIEPFAQKSSTATVLFSPWNGKSRERQRKCGRFSMTFCQSDFVPNSPWRKTRFIIMPYKEIPSDLRGEMNYSPITAWLICSIKRL